MRRRSAADAAVADADTTVITDAVAADATAAAVAGKSGEMAFDQGGLTQPGLVLLLMLLLMMMVVVEMRNIGGRGAVALDFDDVLPICPQVLFRITGVVHVGVGMWMCGGVGKWVWIGGLQ